MHHLRQPEAVTGSPHRQCRPRPISVVEAGAEASVFSAAALKAVSSERKAVSNLGNICHRIPEFFTNTTLNHGYPRSTSTSGAPPALFIS